MKNLLAAAALLALAATPAAAEVNIAIDTSLADRSLGLVCSGVAVNEAEVRASPLVQAQVRHNARLNPAATMDAYVAALRALSACAAPADDPFQVAAILQAPDAYRAKAAAIHARQNEMSARASAMIEPYLPAGVDFRGSAVLAVPYFSCGGFADGPLFFVDIACLDNDLSRDIDALTMMIAHETYHSIQAQIYFAFDENAELIRTADEGVSYMFSALLWEGMAEHVASSNALPENGGPLTELNRHFAQDNNQRPRANFLLLTTLIDYVARRGDDPRGAMENAYGIAFSGGTYQQFAYYVGARMAADIEETWGRPTLICIARLPSEQFVLAHDGVADAKGETRRRLGPAAIDAARRIAAARGAAGFETCRIP